MLDCQQAQASTGRPPPSQEKMSLSELWQTLVRTNRLPDGTDIPPLITLIRDRLHNPEKEIRQHALRVLADLIPVLPKNNLKQLIRPILPSMITNLGHCSIAVRKSAIDCLKTYIKHSPTPNDDLSEVIKIDEDTAPNTITGILTSLPSFVRPEILTGRSIEKSIDILWHFGQQCVNEEVCMKSLAKIKWKIGTDTFHKLLGTEKLKPFENLCEKYGLLESPDDDCSSSSPEDKVILETEFKLDSGPSIKLQIHEESSDKEIDSSDQGIVRILEDDSDMEFYEGVRETPRTPRRVHFGGEIVKMRTPESDSTQTSDSEKKLKKSSTHPQSFVKVNEKTILPSRISTKKEVSRSLENLTMSTENKKLANNTKIPIPITSVPSSPAKTETSKVVRKRLHSSAPNLTRSSKIPKKVSEKNINTARTYSVSKNQIKENTTQKITTGKNDKKETVMKQEENIFQINENVRMIELNIKNNIALQIMFTNGNGIVKGSMDTKKQNGDDHSAVKITELTEVDSKKNVKEEAKKIQTNFTSTSQSEIKKTDKKELDYPTTINMDSTISKVPSTKIDNNTYSARTEEVLDITNNTEVATETKAQQKEMSTKTDNMNIEKANLGSELKKSDAIETPSRITSPLVDENFLLQSVAQPRRYSRAEDILSPVPIHNEIEMLHNLTRSPEHTRKTKSVPTPTATEEFRSVTPTQQKIYESFKVYNDDVICNNNQNEQKKNSDESQKNITESNDEKVQKSFSDTVENGSDIKQVKPTHKEPQPKDISFHNQLLEIIESLQELDLSKKSYAFDNLVASLQDVDFIKSFDSPNAKSLFQLLFLFETQARFRKGSREALLSILEHVPERVIMDCIPQIAKGIGRMGAPYGIKLAITVMKRGNLAEELLNNLPFESSRGREGSLQILIATCRLFPSSDVDINSSIRKVILALSDRRKRVRHAALETSACLAQVGGNSAIFDMAKRTIKDEEVKEVLLKVLKARLSRRQLPMVDFDGNIRYTVPRDSTEIQWISPGGSSNHSAPSQLHYLQRTDLLQGDDLVPLRNTNAAIIPLELKNTKKISQRRGVLRPVYCILPSPEESDEGPTAYYPEEYGRERSILPPAQKIRSESQDRLRWRERFPAKRFPRKYDIRKSFSSDQLYNCQPVSLDYRSNLTSTSSISSGSDYSSSNGSQSRSSRWQGSGIPVLRPRGYWGSPLDKTRPSHDSPSSLRSNQRQSSGSESSGYFTPPPTERPIVTTRSAEPPEKVIKAVTPLVSPVVPNHNEKELIESETSRDEPVELEEEDVVEYIEVINRVPTTPTEEKISQDVQETIPQETPSKQDPEPNHEEDHPTEPVGTDEVDKKGSCPSINEFDLTVTRPIEDNRKWSKSELNLDRSLPIIVDRKHVNSAPHIKDIFNNNVTENIEETTVTGPTHICNNTNINITIPLPGSLIQEEQTVTEPTLVRKLSKRYSQVPIPKKTTPKANTETGVRSSSKTKTNIVHDVLEQMASQEWETVMTGLRNLGKLAKTDKEIIEPHMHEICLSLANHIKNLRSQVARAACQASREMFVACSQKGLEAELDEIVGPLLHRTADTNKFLREDANDTLDSMIKKINPTKAIVVLTTKGTTHQNAIVRGTTIRLLESLVRSQGTEKVFSLGKDVRNRVISAGANALTEGSLETRKHAKMLLGHMISHANFQKALLEAVPPHTIRHIAKTLNSLKHS
ncbi:hypothetical protein WA026_009647 [Henosepilachna vigintioctopunctata]|uniref:TOG domain-containing protein n=1 Tax=Henosepilachna vigintioctopunctata TaxID=420089 RepID=A0AAW1U004_9CUCU